MEISLKPATLSDWQLVQSVESSIPPTNIFHPITMQSDIETYITNSRLYFIFFGSTLAGTISYEMKPDKSAYFDGLVIMPKYQNRGLGSQALVKILEELTNAPRLWLHTHPHNTPALRLYLKNGFIVTKWVENLFKDGEPRLVLEKIQFA